MDTMTADQTRDAVRQRYREIARTKGSCCGPTCCGPSADQLGYTKAEIALVPEGADLGLGCGNPQAIAQLQPGEVVLDLGSGAGIDCFLAAERVGPSGRVIGVDMTPEMLARARDNARAVNAANIEFRMGEIEHLPVADATVDVVISNCVVNLSPDKPAVYREAHRVLKPGGRVAIADIVAVGELPEEVQKDLDALTGCVAGAASITAVERMLADAGFVDVRVRAIDGSDVLVREWLPGSRAADYVLSATVEARKA
jgi:SAM-dependent methyltransferase